jgi:DNA-binding MurR/RpiR family transcriptional regulator
MSRTKELNQRIRALGQLTPSESKIADYFSRNYWNLVFENTTSISENTGVSKATVVRFISKLGYKRFSAFIDDLRKDFVEGQGSLPIRYYLKKKLLAEDAAKDVLGHSFSNITKNLQQTHARIDQDQFWEAARLIARTQGAVFITGQRSSYALAYLFYNMIHRIRPACNLIGSQTASLPDRLIDVGSEDLLFAIFRHPYAKATLRIAQHFERCGAPVILLTDSAFNPLQSQVRVQIEVDTEGVSIFTSSAAVVAVLESLNTAVLKFCDDTLYKRLENSEALYNDFEVFCPGKSLNAERIAKLKREE